MEATQTIDYAIEKLQPVFAKLGELGVAGWQVVVRQQVIEGSLKLFLMFVLLTTAAALIRWAMKKAATIDPEDDKPYGYHSQDRYTYDVRPTAYILGFGCAVLAGGVIFAMFSFASSVAQVLNPQWAAIQSLMSLVK